MIRRRKIIILLGQIIFALIILSTNIVCPFKLIFHFDCPFCGLTRSFMSLFCFDVVSSIKYNCFGIFLFSFFCFYDVILILDFIFKRDYETKFYSLLKSHYLVIMFVFLFCYLMKFV